MAQQAEKDHGIKIITTNREVRYDYISVDTLDAGPVPQGTHEKSLRTRHPPQSRPTRKLLLRTDEIRRLADGMVAPSAMSLPSTFQGSRAIICNCKAGRPMRMNPVNEVLKHHIECYLLLGEIPHILVRLTVRDSDI